MPKVCLTFSCCSRSKRDKFFAKAREKLTDELDLVTLLVRFRYFDQALKTLLLPEKAYDLKLKVEKLPIGKPVPKGPSGDMRDLQSTYKPTPMSMTERSGVIYRSSIALSDTKEP